MENSWFTKSLWGLFVLLFFIPLGVIAQYEGRLGINLGSVHSEVWVDVVKSARAWEEPSGGVLPADKIDSDGWPKSDFRTVLMDQRPVAEWAGDIDDPEKHRIDVSGIYKGSFTGQADIVNLGGSWTLDNLSYDSQNNVTTFNIVISSPGTGHGLVIILFENTKRSSTAPLKSGITELKIIRPGYEQDRDDPFTDCFFTTLNSADFSVIRSQNFSGTTSWAIQFPNQYHWQDRKLPGYAIQGGRVGKKLESAAWEYYIDICNRANTDIWVNIPISASDDYVVGLAQLLRDSLKAGLKIYVENDNEVWNSAPGFVGTYNYNHNEAVDIGISDEENIARRAHELSVLFASVFGDEAINTSVRIILASHAPMLKWWVKPMLQYLNANFGPPRDYIWGLSRQTYFTAGGGENGGIDQMIDAFLKNIKFQLVGNPVNNAGRLDWVRVANEWQLPGGVTSYEGGPDTPSGGSTNNLANKILLNRDEKMIKVMHYNLVNNWWDVGGGLALHFTLFSNYTRYGAYGLTDDLHDPDRNYKFEALRHLSPVITQTDFAQYSGRFSIYPNPAEDYFSIIGNKEEMFEVTVFDVMGQEKLSATSHIGYVIISTNGWSSGLYLIHFKSANTYYTARLLIK